MRQPVEFRRHLEQTPDVIRRRLRDAIDRGAFVPARRPDGSRPTIVGSIDGDRISLSMHDENFMTRRKSWNVTFDGVLATDGSGAIIQGAVEIPDRKHLDQLMVLFKLAGFMLPVIVGGLAIKQWLAVGTWSPEAVVGAVMIAFASAAVMELLRAQGEIEAAEDAAVIVGFLDGVAGSGDQESGDATGADAHE